MVQLVFALPFWGHLSACLGLADALARRGGRTTFAFVYPPPPWVAEEIDRHGHDCEWSLRYVRSALGSPDAAGQRQAMIAAETEIIRAASPDVVVSDSGSTTPVAARACGVPVASITRCPGPEPLWRELLGDVQLVPHPPQWLPVPAPGVVYCRPAHAQRMGIVPAPVEPRPVVASLNTADPSGELPLLLEAFERLDAGWVLCHPHPNGAATGSPRVVAWADHDALLAHARVLVCHGGHGLIGRAIMHGVPVVVLDALEPYSPIYGRALEAAEAGILVRRGATAAAVREATMRAMDDARLHAGAAALRRSCEALPDIADALVAGLRTPS